MLHNGLDAVRSLTLVGNRAVSIYGPAGYLDGVVQNLSVSIAPNTRPPFVGTAWNLHPDNGAWIIKNQNLSDTVLSSANGRVFLGSQQLGAQICRWLLYRRNNEVYFAHINGGWLCSNNSGALLDRECGTGWIVQPHAQKHSALQKVQQMFLGRGFSLRETSG